MRQHTNSFDLVRLVAAGLVVWSHQYALLGLPEPAVAVLRTSFGGLGVLIFFAVSGYLNTVSISRSRSVPIFLLNRALRIYPALLVCVVLTATLGLFVASDLRAYVSLQLASFIVKDSTLFFGVRAGVPGVFEANAFPEALNGSIWTLPYEAKMYVVLALGMALCRYRTSAPLVVFAGAGTLALCAVVGLIAPRPETFWLTFSTLFLAGSAVAAAEAVVGLPLAIAALAGFALLFAALGDHYLAWELFVAAFVVAVGAIKPPRWLVPPLDLSYGIYLYSFPVQQISATLTTNFWLALAFSSVITFALALFSALTVERLALGLKPKLRAAWQAELPSKA